MSATDRIQALFAAPEDSLTILTGETAIEYDLGDGHRLELHGRPSDDAHPIRYRVVDESGSRPTPKAAFAPPAAMFDTPSLVDRFAAVVGALVDSGAADTFREVAEDLCAEYRDGRLLFIDERALRLIRSTERVEYEPSSTRPWMVYLVDDHTPNDWGIDRVQIGADDWVSDRPTIRFPTGLETNLEGGRWRQVRLIWTLMYARDAGPAFGRAEE